MSLPLSVFVRVWTHPATIGTGHCKHCLVLQTALMVRCLQGSEVGLPAHPPQAQVPGFLGSDVSEDIYCAPTVHQPSDWVLSLQGSAWQAGLVHEGEGPRTNHHIAAYVIRGV